MVSRSFGTQASSAEKRAIMSVRTDMALRRNRRLLGESSVSSASSRIYASRTSNAYDTIEQKPSDSPTVEQAEYSSDMQSFNPTKNHSAPHSVTPSRPSKSY